MEPDVRPYGAIRRDAKCYRAISAAAPDAFESAPKGFGHYPTASHSAQIRSPRHFGSVSGPAGCFKLRPTQLSRAVGSRSAGVLLRLGQEQTGEGSAGRTTGTAPDPRPDTRAPFPVDHGTPVLCSTPARLLVRQSWPFYTGDKPAARALLNQDRDMRNGKHGLLGQRGLLLFRR